MVDGRPFKVRFPRAVWSRFPERQKAVLAQNVTFGAAQVLPLMLKKPSVRYQFPQPISESFFFQNHLCDLLSCEAADEVRHLSYVRDFYNLEYEFAPAQPLVPVFWPGATGRQPSAILPFSFGKESLVTLGLCLELGIRPVLVYCQEPAHPFEEVYKRKRLKQLSAELGVKSYYVGFEPGLFRYGKAFGLRCPTELGWGSQTTILSLLCLPFALAERAPYVLIGSEQLNNEVRWRHDWKMHPSYDQTSHWTGQQRHLLGLLSGGATGVYSTLESLEEINIFCLLHHRYPQLGKYHFSCSAQRPLAGGSAWCHKCYKCERMFLFARACGIDPWQLGFKKDLMSLRGGFRSYFGTESATGAPYELDFAFLAAYRKGLLGAYEKMFRSRKLSRLRPWREYVDYFSRIHPHRNRPPRYAKRMESIFKMELSRFGRIVSGDA